MKISYGSLLLLASSLKAAPHPPAGTVKQLEGEVLSQVEKYSMPIVKGLGSSRLPIAMTPKSSFKTINSAKEQLFIRLKAWADEDSDNIDRQQTIKKIKTWFNARNPNKQLDLSLVGTYNIPNFFPKGLKNLKAIDNRLPAVPEELMKLTSLSKLDLSYNDIPILPAEFVKLTSLTELQLDNNKLTNLPDAFGKLTLLTDLSLGANELTALPAEIGKLSDLQKLNLNSNQISDLPAEISQLASLTHLDLSNNQFERVPRALLDLPSETEIDLRDNPLPPEEIAAVREELARRLEAGQTAPQIIFTEHAIINDDNALQLAMENGLNVHSDALTQSFKQRLDKLVAQFPTHFQGDITQQQAEMRAIQQRLTSAIELHAQGNPFKEIALSTSAAMFEKAYGQRAEFFNDFKYTSGRVLSYVMLAMERQWARTPVAHRAEAQANGMKVLCSLLAEGKDFCDTRHIEEVLQMISLPLSSYAQKHPEVIGNVAALPPSPDQVRDITFPVAQGTLRDLMLRQSQLTDDELKNTFCSTLKEIMSTDHPAITPEQLDTYLQKNILAHWDAFKEHVIG